MNEFPGERAWEGMMMVGGRARRGLKCTKVLHVDRIETIIECGTEERVFREVIGRGSGEGNEALMLAANKVTACMNLA